VLAVLLGAANYFLWQERQQAAQEHEQVRRKGEAMLRSLGSRARINTDLAALKEALDIIELNLLDEQSMEVNLGYFYKLEKPARVRLVRLNQLAAPVSAKKSAFKALPFSMQISGSYRNVMSYVRALETGPRIVRVRTSSFEKNTNDNSELLAELTVEVLAKP
jgi:Tfp pilus assembly protein PilO